MSKYKIIHRASGRRFKPEYRDSIAGAIKFAQSKEWHSNEDPSWAMKPVSAEILAKIGDVSWRFHGNQAEWETIATVDKKGVHPVPWAGREAVTRARRVIEKQEEIIDEATTVYLELQKFCQPSVQQDEPTPTGRDQ